MFDHLTSNYFTNYSTIMHQYKKLAIWITSRELIVLVYGIVNRLPKSEQYILIPQLLRASISISLNIAEGSGRGTDKDFSHFIDIALGSLYETETCLYLI